MSSAEITTFIPNGRENYAGLIRLCNKFDTGDLDLIGRRVTFRARIDARSVIDPVRDRASGGQSCDIEKSILVGRRIQPIDIAINTFLLVNDVVEIHLVVEDCTGKVLAESGVPVRVSNTTRLAEQVRHSMAGFGTPLFFDDGDCSAEYFDYSDQSLRPWFDREDAAETIDKFLAAGQISDAESELLKQFLVKGYMILEDCIEESLLVEIDEALDRVVDEKIGGYEYGSSERIRGLHDRFPAVHSLWKHPRIMRLLSIIFQEKATPCQTLTYIFGSQQAAHQDTVHLTPFPAGYMCGVWVAIEDIKKDSGELVVYPGSHRLPRIYRNTVGCPVVADYNEWRDFDATVAAKWREMLKSENLETVVYRPKRGTALIWHENLLHGGSRRADEALTRRSIVSHYFADGAAVFYDTAGLPGIVSD